MYVDIEHRRRILVNTDPQRRCYNGCHASSELRWSEWGVVDWQIALSRVEDRLRFWKDLNDYAVSQRGEGAQSEYRAIIGKYRGFTIYRDHSGHYYSGGLRGMAVRRCNSAWECQESIDEELSP